MLALPVPWVRYLPSLLYRHLYDSSLSHVTLLGGRRSRQYTAQKQSHVKVFAQDRPPM